MPAEGGILTTSIWRRIPQSMLAFYEDQAGRLARKTTEEPFGNKIRWGIFLLLAAVILAGLSLTARPQSVLDTTHAALLVRD